MKNIITICLLAILGFSSQGYAQDDEFKIYSGLNVGLLPIKVSGVIDVGEGGSSVSGSSLIPTKPVFRWVDTTSLVMNFIGHVGASIPVYKTDNWSLGLKLGAGLGIEKGVRAAEGFYALALDFPEFIYYKNYKGRFEYTLMAGYKYTRATLPYHLIMGGFEFDVKDDTHIRLYGSISRYNYYSLFTDGTLEPSVRIREFGLAYLVSF